jgi:phage-related protein
MQIALHANIIRDEIQCSDLSFMRQSGRRSSHCLRVFIKKTQKTPSAELRLALKGQQEMLDEQEDY